MLRIIRIELHVWEEKLAPRYGLLKVDINLKVCIREYNGKLFIFFEDYLL